MDLSALDPAEFATISFAGPSPVVMAAAPGRLDVMGGIADYSGATVLQLPLEQAVVVAGQTRDHGLLVVQTGGPGMPALERTSVTVPAALLYEGQADNATERLRDVLVSRQASWAAYVLGSLAVLRRHGLLPAVEGLRLDVWSSVPAGAGVSSSAALEIASLRAVSALLDIELTAMQLALLAQEAEHRVAASPCGIMDQATATLGRKDHLLVLRCQPADVLGHRLLPPRLLLCGIHSGVTHSVAGAQYRHVRTAAFMGRTIIYAQDGASPPDGYLCNLNARHFSAEIAPRLPDHIDGRAFLYRFGQLDDAVARVEPDIVYRVRDCTTHPVLEQENISAFIAGLDRYEQAGNLEGLRDAGEAMYRSHESYGERCDLGSPETDLIVEMVRELGPKQGLYGARITGGGAGGTVAVLGEGEDAREAVRSISREYSRRTGNDARIIGGSADGAWYRPVRRMSPDEVRGCHV